MKMKNGFKCKHCPETFFTTRKDAYLHLINEHGVEENRVNEEFDKYIHKASTVVEK